MTIKFRLTLGLLLLAPAMAHALGLGDMRLGSSLNQAFSADIEIVGASSEDVLQLRASLPAREVFTRYGVDRPGFLSTMVFRVGKDASGHTSIHVSTPDAVTEPFVTFLVEVTWPRGHLIREYTALLDPPVFEQKPAAPAPMAAPVTGETTSAASGAVVRTPPAETAPAVSAPTATPAPAPARPSAAPASDAGSINSSEYRVAAHDTLTQIAHRAGATSRSDVNRLMIATFRANPNAFDGNINRLRKGATLKIPGSADWGNVSASEARQEVGRQMSAWRESAGVPASAGEEAHLRLVPPSDNGKTGTAPAPGPSPAETAKAAAQAKADKIAADKRLLDLKNEELARAQALAAQKAQPPAATPPAATPPAATAPAATPAEATPPEATAPVKPVKKAVPPPAAATPGLLDSINWLYVGGAILVLALLGLFGFAARRRRRADADFDHALQTADAGEAHTSTTRVPRNAAPRDSMVVEESDDDSGEFQAPPIARLGAAKAAPSPSIDDTLSSETALNLEQADPLAEADFHMAYGLYDQAADIVKLAIGREPARRDLKLKLLEVYFVWGNKDAFLDVARDLARTRDSAAAGEWDKVVIMGRQIAGEDPLFAGAAVTAPATDVDLDLEAGGSQGVDLELLGGDAPAPKSQGGNDFVDLDLGSALAGADSTADTGESRTLDPDRLDLLLEGEQTDHGDHGGQTTREMRPGDGPTVEQPALRNADAPTVETPVLSSERENTIREKLDLALRRERSNAADATAELSLDDLGFEIEKLGSTSTSLEALSITDHPSDAPTMIAGLDDNTRALLTAAEKGLKAHDLDPTRETPKFADLEPTRESPRRADLEPTRESPRPPPDATQRLPEGSGPASDTGTARVLGAGDLDLDLDELARALEHDTVEQPRREEVKFSTDVFQTAIRKGPNGLDLDVGAPLGDHREPTVTERINADDLALPELEPVTLSEVGTKLDLARAYMDMGDPDGARSILQEVLTEGSSSQKQEAQRLIETLPG